MQTVRDEERGSYLFHMKCLCILEIPHEERFKMPFRSVSFADNNLERNDKTFSR